MLLNLAGRGERREEERGGEQESRRNEIILFEVVPLDQIRDRSSRGSELKCTNETQSNHSLTKKRRGKGKIV